MNLACNDTKSRFSAGRQILGDNRIDPRENGPLRNQSGQKSLDIRLSPFYFDHNAVGVIADEAAQALLHRKPIDKRSEADSLNHTSNPDILANGCCTGPGRGR